jgi:uncharacterized SAM-binding protein YcdF (DUF218 family)
VESAIVLKALAKAVILPPAGPLLVAIAGLILWKRSPKVARVLATAGVVALLLLSMPAVAWLLTRGFDREPFDPADAGRAAAIVIIGGGVKRMAPEYAGDTLGRLTLERVRYGAWVAKQAGLPILVSGGRPSGAQRSEAEIMADALASEYGLKVRWQENRSRNTHENAQLSARILRSAGIDRVVLVAHAIDMPRATAEFHDAGIATIPAATGLPVRAPLFATDFAPNVDALQASRDALYELLANLVRAVDPTR